MVDVDINALGTALFIDPLVDQIKYSIYNRAMPENIK